MTEAERQRCNDLARGYHTATGAPLFVTPTMAKHMREAGIDMAHVREYPPIPYARPR